MKLTTGILAVVMMTGAGWGQNPAATDNSKSLTQTKTNGSGAVLVATAVPGSPAKPAAGAPAPAVKPAAIPGAKPAAAAAPAKPAAAQNNTLERVNVVHKTDDIQIEISSREAVTPKVSKLSSPARVVVELPGTTMGTPQNKIAVGSAGVKGVRIGMDGKTPPTTSVVVDLEQACSYDVTPGAGNTLVLTLHTQGAAAAKSAPVAAPVKTAAPAVAKSVPATVPAQAPAKTSAAPPKVQTVAAKPVAVPAAATPKVATSAAAPSAAAAKTSTTKAATTKVADPFTPAKPAAPAAAKIVADDKPAGASKIGDTAKPKAEEKKWAMSGKRDPFFSPVVQQPTGSGCSAGKKCLEIGQINVRGVVKAESGFIAVVTNSLNKAYFLHENDPVFNGYVVRITGDSVVFQETVQDKLGKPFTREVVKRITTPAV